MAPSAADHRAFVLRRLHSLSGVVPLGVFLVEHLWTNAAALGGQPAFDAAVGRIQRLPGLVALEVFGIFLPLAFHAGLGIVIAARARPNALRYPYAKSWLYVLQRVSGFVALAFVLVHVVEYRGAKAWGGLRAEDFYPRLEAHLSWTSSGVPWIAIGYVVGLLATVFHFANGLWGFGATWGLLVSQRAQRRAGWVAAALGAALFALGLQIIVFFATGSRAFLPDIPEPGPAKTSVPCPPSSPPGRISP